MAMLTMIFVSHDRYLIRSVATHVWAIEGGALRVILGGWDAYVSWRRKQDHATQSASQAGALPEDRGSGRRRTRRQSSEIQKLRRRHQEVEDQIDSLEKELAGLNDMIGAAGTARDAAQIDRLAKQYAARDDQLKELWAEWEEVGEQLE